MIWVNLKVSWSMISRKLCEGVFISGIYWFLSQINIPSSIKIKLILVYPRNEICSQFRFLETWIKRLCFRNSAWSIFKSNWKLLWINLTSRMTWHRSCFERFLKRWLRFVKHLFRVCWFQQFWYIWIKVNSLIICLHGVHSVSKCWYIKMVLFIIS